MTTQERVEEIRRAVESAACEHGEWMCSYCENAMIARAIDAAVAEEREACAKVADENSAIATSKATKNVAYFVAEEIRARGSK
jgi:aerobic-type carbon monoxide dehydrogenase small subunit (CoxS/CutS family)